MSDLVTFLRARLDEDQAAVEQWFDDCPEIRAHIAGTEGHRALNP